MKNLTLAICLFQFMLAGPLAQAKVNPMPDRAVILRSDSMKVGAILAAPYSEVASYYQAGLLSENLAIFELDKIKKASNLQSPSFGDILQEYKHGSEKMASVEALVICVVGAIAAAGSGGYFIGKASGYVKGYRDGMVEANKDWQKSSQSQCSEKTSFIYNQLQGGTQASSLENRQVVN